MARKKTWNILEMSYDEVAECMKKNDTIMITFYNAPRADILKKHYIDLPQQLEAEGIDPRVPWLYDFKLDFRFK